MPLEPRSRASGVDPPSIHLSAESGMSAATFPTAWRIPRSALGPKRNTHVTEVAGTYSSLRPINLPTDIVSLVESDRGLLSVRCPALPTVRASAQLLADRLDLMCEEAV